MDTSIFNILGNIIDNNANLTMGNKNNIRPGMTIRTRNKDIALLISKELNMRIGSFRSSYIFYGRGEKITEIYDLLKDFIFILKSKFEFIVNFLKTRPDCPMFAPMTKEKIKPYKNYLQAELQKFSHLSLEGNRDKKLIEDISFDPSICNAEKSENLQQGAIQKKIFKKENKIAIKEAERYLRQEKLLNDTKERNRKNLLIRANKFNQSFIKRNRVAIKNVLSQIKNTPLEKLCPACQLIKPIDLFGLNASSIDSHKGLCKKCNQVKYAVPNKAKLNARVRQWQRDNPEKVKIARRRIQKRPKNRIKSNLCNRLRKFMFSKSKYRLKFADIIGCSMEQLRDHLSSQFSPSMCFSNYGKIWEVDHSIPCEAFNLLDKEQVLLCWNYRNLRPLLRKENYEKSDKLPNGVSVRVLKKENPEILTQIIKQELAKLGIIKHI